MPLITKLTNLRAFSTRVICLRPQTGSLRSFAFHETAASQMSMGYAFDEGRKPNYLLLAGSELSVKALSNWLNCSVESAEKLCENIPELRGVHLDVMFNSIQLIKDGGYSSNLITSNPWILLHPFGTLLDKISLLSHIEKPSRGNLGIFLKLPVRRLTRIMQQWIVDAESMKTRKFQNRLHFLASNLDCTEEEMAQILVKHSLLMIMDFSRLSSMLVSLLESGVKQDDIKNNISVLLQNEQTLTRRLATMNELKVIPIKSWLLKCPERVFDERMENWGNYDVQDATKETPVQYLARKLKCSEDYVLYLSQIYPRLLGIQRHKVSATLDLLLQNGFTVEQISRAPHVFRTNLTVLQSRLEELKSLSYHLNNLSPLYTKDTFLNLLNQVKREKEAASISRKINSRV